MSERTYTERDVVIARRLGYITHAQEAYSPARHSALDSYMENIERRAAERYPLPKVTRPRREPDPYADFVWSVRADELVAEHYELRTGTWHTVSFGHSVYTPRTKRVKLWADLILRPTEEVDE